MAAKAGKSNRIKQQEEVRGVVTGSRSPCCAVRASVRTPRPRRTFTAIRPAQELGGLLELLEEVVLTEELRTEKVEVARAAVAEA